MAPSVFAFAVLQWTWPDSMHECEALAGQALGLFAEASAAQRAKDDARQRAELGLAAK